MTEISEVI